MLEALEGLPESEQAKYLDITGQCWGGVAPNLAPWPWFGSTPVTELCVCVPRE